MAITGPGLAAVIKETMPAGTTLSHDGAVDLLAAAIIDYIKANAEVTITPGAVVSTPSGPGSVTGIQTGSIS